MSRSFTALGNATVELLVALLALSPLLLGIPLLGKQLDLKHKTYDAARYTAWERTVWSSAGASNRKTEQEISLEGRERVLGDPRSGVIPLHTVRALGVSENPLWRDASNRRLLISSAAASGIATTMLERAPPVEVGSWLAPGIAYGEGSLDHVVDALQVRHLGLDRRGFVDATTSIALRPRLLEVSQRRRSLGGALDASQNADPLVHRATAAILSDTWSASDESMLRRRVDHVTADEMIEELERPGRIIGMQARGKGAPLYGEGQYGWDPDLNPRSTTLPAAYIRRR